MKAPPVITHAQCECRRCKPAPAIKRLYRYQRKARTIPKHPATLPENYSYCRLCGWKDALLPKQKLCRECYGLKPRKCSFCDLLFPQEELLHELGAIYLCVDCLEKYPRGYYQHGTKFHGDFTKSRMAKIIFLETMKAHANALLAKGPKQEDQYLLRCLTQTITEIEAELGTYAKPEYQPPDPERKTARQVHDWHQGKPLSQETKNQYYAFIHHGKEARP